MPLPVPIRKNGAYHIPEDLKAAEGEDFGRLAIADEPFKGRIALANTVSMVGRDGFELTVTEKVHAAMLRRGSAPQLRKWFTEETQRILDGPLGSTNIDTERETNLRLVHAVQGPLAELLPERELALKGTGLDMSRQTQLPGLRRVALTEQFRAMHSLGEKQRAVAPEGLGGLIMINEVHGVVAYHDPALGQIREWMLMDRVTDAQPVDEALVFDGSGPTPRLAFKRSQYPMLANYADAGETESYDENISFMRVGRQVAEDLGYAVDVIADLNGHNIFEQQTPDGPQYTIIDINGHPR